MFDMARTTLTSYADDLKLFSYTECGLQAAFSTVQFYLSRLGLTTSASKGFVLHVTNNKSKPTHITVEHSSLELQPHLRFLGVKLLSTGSFAPWRDSFDWNITTLRARLTEVGLGNTPEAIMRGIFIKVLPALTFGCEIWGLSHVYSVLF